MGKHAPTAILASYLVLLQGGRVLLARRKNTGYRDGYYSLPAGHVESGETFSTALRREVEEEIGLQLSSGVPILSHIAHRKGEDGSERVDAFFVVKEWVGEVRNLEPEKCDDLSWFPVGELPEKTIPYIRTVLGEIEKSVFYSELGW